MATIGTILYWFAGNRNECHANNVDPDISISRPWNIAQAASDNISFVGGKHAGHLLRTLRSTACRLVIIDRKLFSGLNKDELPERMAFIVSDDPKSDLITLCKVHFPVEQKEDPQIHASACISDGAVLGSNVSIGACAVIEQGAAIGDNSSVDAGTLVKGNVTIGSNVTIGASCVLGGVGFGYSKNDTTGVFEQFPHYGGVIIKADVNIGNNVCIDRGSLSDTIIETGVRIDNLVHIAHNVVIGKNSLIIAQTMIGGSAVIGENCWLAPSSCIRNGISIGNNTTVGLASTVTKNIDSDSTVVGSPAIDLVEHNQLRKRLRRLMDP